MNSFIVLLSIAALASCQGADVPLGDDYNSIDWEIKYDYFDKLSESKDESIEDYKYESLGQKDPFFGIQDDIQLVESYPDEPVGKDEYNMDYNNFDVYDKLGSDAKDYMFLQPLSPDYPINVDYNEIRPEIPHYSNDFLEDELQLKKLPLFIKSEAQIIIIEESIVIIPKMESKEVVQESLIVEQISKIESQENGQQRFTVEEISEGRRRIFLIFGWTLMVTGMILSCLVIYVGRKMARERQRKVFVCKGQLPYEPLHSEV